VTRRSSWKIRHSNWARKAQRHLKREVQCTIGVWTLDLVGVVEVLGTCARVIGFARNASTITSHLETSATSVLALERVAVAAVVALVVMTGVAAVDVVMTGVAADLVVMTGVAAAVAVAAPVPVTGNAVTAGS